jgi:hypothetical protein
MHISINTASQFRDHFAAMDREHFSVMGRESQFSYESLNLLYDYLEENAEGYELDVIALCCEYAEDTEQGIAKAYGLLEDDDVVAYLEDHTQVVGVTKAGTILYAQF